MKKIIIAAILIALTACARAPSVPGTEAEISTLAAGIRSLSPTIDPTEAARAARISYQTTFALAQAYQITDSPLIHNAKVNAGTRPRGLCYHWAEDMEARLNREDFKTLEITRAIANSENRFLIEHSTAVITATDDTMEDGMVLDPWREGGTLFWAPVRSDTRYDWLPRLDVLRAKGQVRYAQRTEGSLAVPPAE